MAPRTFALGDARDLRRPDRSGELRLPPHHLVTHGVVVGMTGSGKTGLVTVLAEEALRAKVPVLVIDVKGDLPNLLLGFPSFAPSEFEPYAEAVRSPDDPRPTLDVCAELAAARQRGLTASGVGEADLRAYARGVAFRLVTPGGTVGESLHLLSSLERRPARWDADREVARNALDAAVSLLLRLLGRESDPARSREHVLLAALAAHRFDAGLNADLADLIVDVEAPPFERLGAMDVEAYLSRPDRHELAARLNSLLASHALSSWRTGASLDVGDWLTPRDGRTPAVILSVAHLDDDARAMVLSLVLDELLAWVRSRPGAQHLSALVLFDEVHGFVPPHPHNPPTKRPLVALMKQARACGVGVVLATQNPMDLDYRALGNAGLWCIGRLQTDADRARVVDGLTGAPGHAKAEGADLANTIKRLAPRWFVVRDAHDGGGAMCLLRPRHTISWLRGPMTRGEIERAQERRDASTGSRVAPQRADQVAALGSHS